ncbi:MAG: TIGR03032 family protein [Alphaproteobacteria bacterium]|nr:TIGR03032 family protein [Alphaproteobacteria bacterium]
MGAVAAKSRKSKAAAVPDAPKLVLEPSPHFAKWLAGLKTSLCLTTYQAGKIFMIGSAEGDRLSVFERTLSRCMGLAATPNSIYVSTQWQLWRLENALPEGETKEGYDAVYVPQVGSVTGEIDIHDMAIDGDGQLVFVNTLFSCLATSSDTHSFRPLWQPSFITDLVPEDRCHLNGLALRDGAPAFVTAVSQTDTAEGWRKSRDKGGCVIDIKSNEVVAKGLSMPHSPRWHDDKLWLHNSGTGEFGHVDLATGKLEPVCFCPGYLRGLTFCDGYAVMGLSKPRGKKAFAGLALDATLKKSKVDAQCGLVVVDLTSGETVHSLKFDGIVEELYDVITLPGINRAMTVGFQNDDIRRVISIEQ